MPEKTKPAPPKKYSLSHLPPANESEEEKGKFFYNLFLDAWHEKARAGLHDRWLENYRIYRGDHWQKAGEDRDKITLNLAFSNILRTTAQLVARNPHSEVKALDNAKDGAEEILNQKLRNDWVDRGEQKKLARSAHKMEIYGPTVEKHVWELKESKPRTIVKDPYSFVPAPGVWEDVARDAPFVFDVYADYVENIERKFGRTGLRPDGNFEYLGEERKDAKPKAAGSNQPAWSQRHGDWSQHSGEDAYTGKNKRALVIECWIRDPATEIIEVDAGTEEVWSEPLTGEPLDQPMLMPVTKAVRRLKYPGGIRRVTVTDSGNVVLADDPNPNVNTAHPREVQENTYGCWRFPFTVETSYEDDQSIWGFSNIEQTADLIFKMDEIYSKIIRYIQLKTMPILIIPQDSGIDIEEIDNEPGSILEPATTNSSYGIRYLEAPNFPRDMLEMVMNLSSSMDRIHSIEEIDRGGAPGRVESASAIAMLQEKNSILLKHKIRSVDNLVTERGKWAISHYQNFHYIREPVEVNGETLPFRGVDLAGREFNYLVDAQSTVHKTEFQERQDAKELFGIGAVDLKTLLEHLDFPNWREAYARTQQGMIPKALSAMVEGGELSPQTAQRIQQLLQTEEVRMQQNMRPQSGGQEHAPSSGAQSPQSGTASAPPASAPNAGTPATPATSPG